MPRLSLLESTLKTARDHFITYLQALTKKDRPQYWQQQISGTLVAYPAQVLQDLHEYFYEKGLKTATPRSIALTAYWIMQLLSEKDLPPPPQPSVWQNSSRLLKKFYDLFFNIAPIDEVETLRIALKTPGRLIPYHGQDTIFIYHKDVTSIAQAFTQIQLLLYLVENYDFIREFACTSTREVNQNYKILNTLNESWLEAQVDSILQLMQCYPLPSLTTSLFSRWQNSLHYFFIIALYLNGKALGFLNRIQFFFSNLFSQPAHPRQIQRNFNLEDDAIEGIPIAHLEEELTHVRQRPVIFRMNIHENNLIPTDILMEGQPTNPTILQRFSS